MRRKTLFVIFILFSIFSHARNTNNDSVKIITLSKEVASLNDKLANLNTDVTNKINYQNSIVQTSFNGVSTQISSASIFLTIFSIVITLIAIVVGIYISRVQKNVQSILEANEKIKAEIAGLNDMIQNDINSLYLKLQTEETKSLIKRLLNVPEDIVNLQELLLARQISPEEYDNFKKAYLKYQDRHGNNALIDSNIGGYRNLFFQHFAGLSYADKEIADDIKIIMLPAINAAFENDILKSSTDIINQYVAGKIGRENLNIFLSNICKSKYKDFDALYIALFDSIKVKNKQFDFYDFIDDKKELLTIKAKFGKLLIENYGSNTENNSEQTRILNDINEKLGAEK